VVTVNYAAEAVSFITAARPNAAGTAITVSNETIQSKQDGKLSGMTPEMEYKIGSGDWMTVMESISGVLANPTNAVITVREGNGLRTSR